MTLNYDIHTGADLLLYVAAGRTTADEYFTLYYELFQDPRRHHGMKVLIDIIGSELEFTAADFKRAVALMRANREAGYQPDHLVILTPSISFGYAVNTLKLLSDELPVFLSISHNFSDAIRWLGLTNQEEELKLFWQAFKHKSQSTGQPPM